MTEQTGPKTPKKPSPGKIKALKARWCVHFMIHQSDIVDDICYAVNIDEETLWKLYHSIYWEQALDYWGLERSWSRYRSPVKDDTERKQLIKATRSLDCAEKLWTEMIEGGYDLFPCEIDNFLREHSSLQNEEYVPYNQIGLEALLPEEIPGQRRSIFQLSVFRQLPKRFWIHNITAVIFAIGSII